MYKIDNFNRSLAIERYVEDIVCPLHLLEAKEMLKDFLRNQKNSLSDHELENEISRHDPLLLNDIYSQELYVKE